MRQTTFFDQEFSRDMEIKRLARTTDPETSKQSAAETSRAVGYLQKKALELVRSRPDSTARELSEIAGWDVWKRISELARSGAIVESGVRVCPITGRNARTWRAKEV